MYRKELITSKRPWRAPARLFAGTRARTLRWCLGGFLWLWAWHDCAAEVTEPVDFRRDGGVHVHDLNATALHCLGIDHTKLTFRFQGRDYRLTDVHGEVVREILH